MFRHSRPHPHVHIVRWHAFRAVRRITVGAAFILMGIAALLRSQGFITQQEMWLVLPGAVALSGLVRMVARPGAASRGGGHGRPPTTPNPTRRALEICLASLESATLLSEIPASIRD